MLENAMKSLLAAALFLLSAAAAHAQIRELMERVRGLVADPTYQLK